MHLILFGVSLPPSESNRVDFATVKLFPQPMSSHRPYRDGDGRNNRTPPRRYPNLSEWTSDVARIPKESQPCYPSIYGSPNLSSNAAALDFGESVDDDFVREQMEILRQIEESRRKPPPQSPFAKPPPMPMDKPPSPPFRSLQAQKSETLSSVATVSDDEGDDEDSTEIIRQQEALFARFAATRESEHLHTKPPPSQVASAFKQCSMSEWADDEAESSSDEEDFTSFLSDPNLIREQRRLFEQIQRESLSSKQDAMGYTRGQDHVVRITEAAHEASLYEGYARQVVGAHQQPLRSVSSKLMTSSMSESSATQGMLSSQDGSNVDVVAASADCVETLSSGKRLRVKGTRHVYKAIERGTATLVRCYNCQTVLQVTSTTKAVYCTCCHQVTPMELAISCDVDGGGSNHSNVYEDRRIASSVQNQEYDVACARKMASYSRRHDPGNGRR